MMKLLRMIESRARTILSRSRSAVVVGVVVLIGAGTFGVVFSHSSSASTRILHVVARRGGENPACPASHPCSLGFAIGQRISSVSDTVIDMTAGTYDGTLVIASGTFDLVADSGQVTLDGNGDGPAVVVDPGAIATIEGSSGVEVTGGVDDADAEGAGGIDNAGSLTLNNVDVTGNSASNADEGAGGIFNEGTMSIDDSSVSSNNASNSDACAGGIANEGTMTISDSSVTNNSCSGKYQFGVGGISNGGYNLAETDSTNPSANLTIENSSTVSQNSASSYSQYTAVAAGGILNAGPLTVSSSTLSLNYAAFSGGGLYNVYGSSVTVTDSSFSQNAAGRNGGGVDNGDDGNSAGISITGSTLYDNNAGDSAGAIDNGDNGGTGILTLTDSTLSDNQANNGGAIENGGDGGTGTATISFSTIDGNTALYLAPGIDNAQNGGSGTLTVTHSTFIGNSGGDGHDIDNRSYDDGEMSGTVATTVAGDLFGEGCGQSFDSNATWTDNGYNAGVDGSCENGGTGDVVSALVGSDVASLTGTPGTPGTLALTTGNPGIGLIPNPTPGLCPVISDESGAATPTGDLCDAGAVENPSLPTQNFTTTTSSPPPAVAPPPTGGVLTGVDYGEPTSATSTSAGEEISLSVVTSTGLTADVHVDIPGGAFTTPTTISVYPINTSSLTPPAGNSYVLSFAVTWENGSGASPNSNVPLTVTIDDQNFTAGGVIYELDSSGSLVPVGTVSTPVPVPPSVTISFDSDPVFVIERPLAPHSTTVTFGPKTSALSAQSEKSLNNLASTLTKGSTVTIVGYAKNNAILARSRARAVAAFLDARAMIHWKVKIVTNRTLNEVTIVT